MTEDQAKELWLKYCDGEFPWLPEKPCNIPRRPDIVYKNDGWKGWVDFIGSEIDKSN